MLYKRIDQIEVLLQQFAHQKIALTTHENPDGDGLSTALAIYYCLENIYQAKPQIVIDSPFPSFLDYLNHQQCCITPYNMLDPDFFFDLLLVLDCHEVDRVDTQKEIFQKAIKVLFIDHHVLKHQEINALYDYYIDDNAVCTGVIINRIFQTKITKNLGSWVQDYLACIYTSIVNDTDNFVNSNSDLEAFQTVVSLMELGLIPAVIVNQFLYRKPICFYKFLGAVLSTLETNNRVTTFYATLEMLNQNGLTTEAYSKLMKHIKGASDIDIAVLFQEYEKEFYRMSVRSDKYDVAILAQHFGGGGHNRAAGFQLCGDLKTVKKQVLEYINNVVTFDNIKA